SMQDWKRGASSVAGLVAVALLVAACSPTSRTNTSNLNVIGAPPTAQPVQNSSVQQNTLPAIGATGTPAPGLSGQPVLGGTSVTTQVAGIDAGSITTVGSPMTSGVSAGPEGV